MSSPAGVGFGQYGAGPNGEPIVSRTIVPLTGSVGQTLQLEYADIYADGSGSGLANVGTWWSLNPSVLSITPDGLATCVAPGSAFIGTILNGAIYAQGLFVVTQPSLAALAITGNVPSLITGQTEQLIVIGTFTDGSTQDVTSLCSFNSSGPGAAVDGTGLVTALKAATVTLTASANGLTASVPLTVVFIPAVTVAPTFRSHLTQVMQNYFDWNDTRVRRGRYTVDAQLLNIAAQQIEMTGLRLGRELGATTLHGCPANIDNSGCYWKQRLPSTFNYSLATHAVVATIGGNIVALTPYDDQLPVPTKVSANSNFSSIPLTNPLLFSATGLGDASTQSWAAQRLGPFTPAFANRLQFWIDGPGYNSLNLMIRITGQRAPAPAWSDAQEITSETIKISSLGWTRSKFAWASIQQVQILGLPAGVTLSAYTGMFSLPMQPDPNRPYADPMYRDVSFARYWQASPGFLTEEYLASDYNGWRFVQSYATNQTLSALAVEPNTWGMWAAAGTTLYYFDRREPLPTNLSASALTEEPLYGLDIEIDETQLSPIKFAVLSPIAYAGAATATSWRYLVQTPDSNVFALTPNGLFAEYSATAGWRNGAPPALTIPLAQQGTYVFSIQATGPDGSVVQDSTPWLNPAFTPLASFDLSSLVSQIQGLSFDDRNRLWVWDGTKATALEMNYDAYIIDQATQAIYLTDSVNGLTIDGTTL